MCCLILYHHLAKVHRGIVPTDWIVPKEKKVHMGCEWGMEKWMEILYASCSARRTHAIIITPRIFLMQYYIPSFLCLRIHIWTFPVACDYHLQEWKNVSQGQLQLIQTCFWMSARTRPALHHIHSEMMSQVVWKTHVDLAPKRVRNFPWTTKFCGTSSKKFNLEINSNILNRQIRCMTQYGGNSTRLKGYVVRRRRWA